MLKVIGLGNVLRGDDGIGPMVIEQLEELGDESIQLIDAGADPFTLLEHLIESDPLLIIDCAEMGMLPGSTHLFSIYDAKFRESANSISLHGFSFADVYRMAAEIGVLAPCKIIGVQPKNIGFCDKLSDEVKASIPTILKMINQEKNSYVPENIDY